MIKPTHVSTVQIMNHVDYRLRCARPVVSAGPEGVPDVLASDHRARSVSYPHPWLGSSELPHGLSKAVFSVTQEHHPDLPLWAGRNWVPS